MSTNNIITVASRKGGVGKSTVTRNLAYLTAKQGFKVLVIDLDSLATLSLSLGDTKGSDLQRTIYMPIWNVICKRPPCTADNIFPAGIIDYIPCNEEYSALEALMASQQPPERDFLLKRAIEDLPPIYDFIYIDIGPIFGASFLNALTASTGVLIVQNAEKDGVVGAASSVNMARGVQGFSNPDLKILGVVINDADPRTTLTREIIRQTREQFQNEGIPVYDNYILHSTVFGKARAAQLSIEEYSPQSKAALSFRVFAKEFLRKGGFV